MAAPAASSEQLVFSAEQLHDEVAKAWGLDASDDEEMVNSDDDDDEFNRERRGGVLRVGVGATASDVAMSKQQEQMKSGEMGGVEGEEKAKLKGLLHQRQTGTLDDDSSDSDSDSDDDTTVVRGAARNRPVPLANRILHQTQGDVVSRTNLGSNDTTTRVTAAATTAVTQAVKKLVPRKKMGKKERQRLKKQKLIDAGGGTDADAKMLAENVLGGEAATVEAEMEREAKLQRKREKRKATKQRKKLGSALAAAVQVDATEGSEVKKVDGADEVTNSKEYVEETKTNPEEGSKEGDVITENVVIVQKKNKRKRKKVRSKQKNARKDNRPKELRPGGSQYEIAKRAKMDSTA